MGRDADVGKGCGGGPGMRRRFAALGTGLFVLVSGLVSGLGSGPARADLPAAVAYVLGPQDRVAIRVNSLRRNTGEIYTWQPLSGEFSVGADGTIFLPVVGQLMASGRTPEALAGAIGEALKNAANLAELPFATVEVTNYRPVFIMGAVERPGRYEFQPGMTVLQALGTAEGFARSPDLSATQREAITAGGNLRELEGEGIALQARLARLEAESGAEGGGDVPDAPAFPAALLARAKEEPLAATAIRHETERYLAGRAALAAELSAIDGAKSLLQQELASLEEKAGTLTRQQALYDAELKVSTDLLDRGLTISSRQIAAENSQLSVQGNLLDVQLARLRAQQSLQQADRDAINLRARYRKEALDSLVVTREQIERNAEGIRTAQALLTLAMSRSLDTVDAADPGSFTPEYRVVRTGPAGREEKLVADDFALLPGDVLQVQMKTGQ